MAEIIGYLGPEGTYSHDVALELFGAGGLRPYLTIDTAIRAVQNSTVAAVVPIENSLEGSVNITLDTLAHEVDLFITREIIKPISHYLLTKESISLGEITEVISHGQALAQCRRFVNKHCPNANTKIVDSTAAAAAIVAKDGNKKAAIASRRAGIIHGLTIAESNIQDQNNNCTRFVVIKAQPVQPSGFGKTSIVCRIKGDRPGSLCEYLQVFYQYNVNLTKIESRPARTGLGEYIFFFDLEGGADNSDINEALAVIEAKTLWFKNLGWYEV